jgi:predicted HAD superfamily hydrolase
VISAEEASARGARVIVIIARASNVRVIFRRIADFCAANAIDVFDITGGRVRAETAATKSFEKYEAITEQCLKAKIDAADVVSFDVFDTLVMRRVLYPSDIFELMGRRVGHGFGKKRIDAEAGMYREGRHPGIYDIYERIPDVSPNAEIALESEYLIRRETMVAMLEYAYETKKEVFLASDMYLPRGEIQGLLRDLGIHVEAGNILVSCDCGASKSSGLFDVLRAKAGAKRILHIGDNFEADTERAKRYGIDDTFHIESALSMLEDSHASKILKYDGTLPNRMIIGEFIGKQLNDPFLFGKTQGKFLLNGAYETAYSLIAPLIYCFFGWLVKKAAELRLECVLLSARDGFIVRNMYDLFTSRGADLPPMLYFYTSRSAAVLAGIKDDGDILHTARLAYAGKTENMLRSRFRLSDGEIKPRRDLDDESYVLLHRDAIMRHAAAAREQYSKYIAKFDITPGANVGFFDFVSMGTCQKALGNFVNFALTGLYFAAMNCDAEYKPDTVIEAMFGGLNVFDKPNCLLENYIFLEHIMTSFEPTLQGFDDSGKPIFIEERRTAGQLRTLREIHGAVLDYAKNTKIALDDICGVDAALPDFLLSLLKPQYSQTETGCFDNAELADEFCNRTYAISDAAY